MCAWWFARPTRWNTNAATTYTADAKTAFTDWSSRWSQRASCVLGALRPSIHLSGGSPIILAFFSSPYIEDISHLVGPYLRDYP